MAKSMDSLWDIFRACDTDGSGYIGKEEVTSICDKFGISDVDANNIFIDLDRDGDGQISFEDFREGFKDYEKCVEQTVDPSTEEISEANLPEKSAYLQIVNKARQSSNLRRVRSFTRKIDRALADDSMDPEKQSKMIEELMENLGKLKTENEMLAKSFMRERREHEEHLQQIEQDVDSQVREVEERYKERAKQEIEAERRSLRELMKEEMDQLQSQLSMFEKVENWLKSNQMNMENEKLGEFRSKLEEALHENRQMRLSLLDTQTTVAMMRSELSQLKNMYEQKCQELTAERERVLEVVNNQDFMARQLMFLQTEVNDRLQQGSENSIRPNIPPISLEESKHIISARAREKKGSIIGDYLKTNSTHSNDHTHGNILEVPSIREDDLLSVPSVRDGAKSEASSDCGYSSRRHDDDNDGLSTMTRDEHDDSNYSSNASERHNSNSDDQIGSRKESEDVNSNWIPGIEESTGPPETLYNLIFIGDMSVGKSTLIYKIVKNKFVTNLCSTVGVDFHMKTLRVDKKTIAVQLWDTGGQERFRSITVSYFRKADGVLILYDVTNERSFINVRNWMSQISEYNGRNIPVVLIGNKVDIRGKATNTVEYDRGKKLADEFDCPFFETSVKEGRNVFLAFGAIVRKMMEIDRGPPRVNEVELAKKPVDIKKKKCCSDK